MSNVPPPVDPDRVDPLIPPVEEVRVVREEHVVVDDAAPRAADADVNVMHEEERVRVLADGSVLREVDRVEQRSRFRDRLPWLLLALAGLIVAVGLIVWYVDRASTKTVPAVVGLKIDAAVARLEQDGFKTQIARQTNARLAGVVFGQNPASGTKHDDGSTVRLLVSKGRGTAKVPNAVGLTQAVARDRLVNAGFKVTTAEVFSSQPRGTVTAQSPAAGGQSAPGTLVHVNISKGSATLSVPSEVGNTIDDARAALAAKGFVPKVLRVPSAEPIDTVVAQSPAGGQVRRGSAVQLNVSKGAPVATTTTPAPTTATTQTQTTTTVTATATATATVTVPTTQTTTVTTPSTSTTSTNP
jgi:beta-lactam-binding protein with PASTA domain